MLPSNACAKGLEGFTKTLMYRLQYIPIFQLSQSLPDVFCNVIERNFPPTTKRNNAHDCAYLHSFRLHFFSYIFHNLGYGFCVKVPDI